MTLQFVRIDLGETPAQGTWTQWVEMQDIYHDNTCEYPACAERNS